MEPPCHLIPCHRALQIAATAGLRVVVALVLEIGDWAPAGSKILGQPRDRAECRRRGILVKAPINADCASEGRSATTYDRLLRGEATNAPL